MGLIASLDRTHDAAAVWDASETLAANATANSSVYDIGPDLARFAGEADADYRTRLVAYMQGRQSAELLQLRLIVTACDVAASSIAFVSVQGSNRDDFGGSVWNLGTIVLGNAAQATSTVGITSTAARGVGEYVLPFYSVAQDAGSVPFQQVRYLRLQSKTTGATSALTFSARIEKL